MRRGAGSGILPASRSGPRYVSQNAVPGSLGQHPPGSSLPATNEAAGAQPATKPSPERELTDLRERDRYDEIYSSRNSLTGSSRREGCAERLTSTERRIMACGGVPGPAFCPRPAPARVTYHKMPYRAPSGNTLPDHLSRLRMRPPACNQRGRSPNHRRSEN